MIGEHQRHLEQRGERSQAIGQLRPEVRRKARDDHGLHDPRGGADPSVGPPIASLGVANGQPADQQWREKQRPSHEEGNRRSSDPSGVVELRRAARRLSFHLVKFGHPSAVLETVS